MLFDLNSLIESPLFVIATLAIILLGKPLVAFLVVALMRYPLRIALSVALILSQIGEFSFILATVGADMGILPANAQNILVAAAIISITLNPLLYRAGGKIERWLDRCTPGLTNCIHARCAPAPATNEQVNKQSGQTHVIVVGYGHVGQTVVRLLMENDICPTIVELNVQTVQSLRTQGYRTVYGDAARINTLFEAKIKNAHALVISVSNVKGENEIVRQARELNPNLRIIARTTYLSNRQNLAAAGADIIFSDEGEVALSVTEMILKQFGATPDQINRERQRVHEGFYESFFSTPLQAKKEETLSDQAPRFPGS
jgi:CPA2 family monovalent cation:H+ antiporter-2